jgi:hypothetical protein
LSVEEFILLNIYEEVNMDKVNFLNYIQSANTMTSAGMVILNMSITMLVALFIYWVYKRTYTGVMYSKNFNITLLLTSMVTAMVMMVIGTNLALSLGMVGALSIVRFRSAIKDPRDIGFIFWGISAGLAAGTGSWLISVVGSLFIAIILLIFSKSSYEDYPFLLVIKGSEINEDKLRYLLMAYVQKYSLRMKNNTPSSSEIIYEVKFEEGKDIDLIKEIKNLEKISNVNIVSYKGEITG